MSSATIEVEDPHVSRQHARIDFMDGVFVIRDLDSRNGTFVNGQPITSRVSLSPGDRIDVGSTRIVVGGLVAWR
jgi:pSer/pThr/pTyr-binding forkhead associated (FHA) protein